MSALRILIIFICLLFLAGCSIPEGGSSLPWNKPESWEQELPIMEEY